jgi:hypothetical protein
LPHTLNHDSGFGGRGQRKPANINAKRVLIAVGLSAEVFVFLLIFERGAVEVFAGFE